MNLNEDRWNIISILLNSYLEKYENLTTHFYKYKKKTNVFVIKIGVIHVFKDD